MKARKTKPLARFLVAGVVLAAAASFPSAGAIESFSATIEDLASVLQGAGFTGRVQSTLEQRLGGRSTPR